MPAYPRNADSPPSCVLTSPDTGPRLRVRLSAPTSEHVDGAWWPRSASLIVEVPGLLEALSDRLGRVVLVGYHRDGWEQAPTQVEFDGHLVRLQGFGSEDPHTVLLIGADGQRLALLVVAPDTPSETAHEVLLTASAPAADGASEGKDTAARSLTDVAAQLLRREGANSDQRSATVTAWVQQAAAQFDHARVQSYVPILVEHIVRVRMASTKAQARVGVGKAATASHPSESV